MLNKIILMGRLVRDPEVRYTQSGKPVASLTLAVDRDFKDKASGEKTTDFVPVVAWEHRAKFVQQYFTKGQMALVEGRLQMRDWTDKDGNKRRVAEVVADQIYFAGSKPGQPSEGNAPVGSFPRQPSQEFSELDDAGEEDLPF